MGRQFILKMLHYIIIVKAERRARLGPAIDGINDQEFFRARDILCQFNAQRATVHNLYGLREFVMLIEIFSHPHAKTFVAQDDIADAQNRDFIFVEYIIQTGRTASRKYISHTYCPFLAAIFFSSQSHHASMPSPLVQETSSTSMPGCRLVISFFADSILKLQ